MHGLIVSNSPFRTFSGNAGSAINPLDKPMNSAFPRASIFSAIVGLLILLQAITGTSTSKGQMAPGSTPVTSRTSSHEAMLDFPEFGSPTRTTLRTSYHS